MDAALEVLCSPSHRMLGQSHPVQDGAHANRAGLYPASFSPEFCGSLSMSLFLSGFQMVSWTLQGWGWGHTAGLSWHPETSQMLPLLSLAWDRGRWTGSRQKNIMEHQHKLNQCIEKRAH